jgi:hypothetical protein
MPSGLPDPASRFLTLVNNRNRPICIAISWGFKKSNPVPLCLTTRCRFSLFTICTTVPAPITPGYSLCAQADKEFSDNNLHAATQIFRLAQENYTAAGNAIAAKNTRDRTMNPEKIAAVQAQCLNN